MSFDLLASIQFVDHRSPHKMTEALKLSSGDSINLGNQGRCESDTLLNFSSHLGSPFRGSDHVMQGNALSYICQVLFLALGISLVPYVRQCLTMSDSGRYDTASAKGGDHMARSQDSSITIRISNEQKRRMQEKARKDGRSLSNWVLHTLTNVPSGKGSPDHGKAA